MFGVLERKAIRDVGKVDEWDSKVDSIGLNEEGVVEMAQKKVAHMAEGGPREGRLEACFG